MTTAWIGLGTDQHDERDHSAVPVSAFAPDTVDARGASGDGTGQVAGGIILARTATDVRAARLGAVGPAAEPGIDAGTTGDVSLFREAVGRWKTPQRLWVAGRSTATQHALMVGDDLGLTPTDGQVSAVFGRTAAPVLVVFGESATVFGYLQFDNAADRAKLATLGAGLSVQSAGGTLSFFDNTPVARPAAYTQTYATTGRTHSNLTSSAVATTAATNVTPFGYTTAAQADAVVAAINALRTDLTNVKNLLNSVIDDQQAYGLLA